MIALRAEWLEAVGNSLILTHIAGTTTVNLSGAGASAGSGLELEKIFAS